MTEATENTNHVPEVRVESNGPIVIRGNFSFRDSSGKIVSGEQEIRICRCGGSKEMPWCDDTHLIIGVPG